MFLYLLNCLAWKTDRFPNAKCFPCQSLQVTASRDRQALRSQTPECQVGLSGATAMRGAGRWAQPGVVTVSDGWGSWLMKGWSMRIGGWYGW